MLFLQESKKRERETGKGETGRQEKVERGREGEEKGRKRGRQVEGKRGREGEGGDGDRERGEKERGRVRLNRHSRNTHCSFGSSYLAVVSASIPISFPSLSLSPCLSASLPLPFSSLGQRPRRGSTGLPASCGRLGEKMHLLHVC